MTMIRFFNRKSRKKSSDFKYNTSKTSLPSHFSHIRQDSKTIVGNSDGTIQRQFYESAISGEPDYGTYSSVNSGFIGGNKPRYSSINALGSKGSGQESPPEIVQYLRPPQNYSSPVRDPNSQMKDLPLTLPSPNRPPRMKDIKTKAEVDTSNCNNSILDNFQHNLNSSQMAASRTSPFASDTSPSYHSPTSIPTQTRPNFPNLKPLHMSPSSTEKSKVNKHIDSYNIQQGHAASGTNVSPMDISSSYVVSTRRKIFSGNQKQLASGVLTSNVENSESRAAQNPPNSTADELPHRSLPKPPEHNSYVTNRGNVTTPSSYVGRNAKIQTKEINDYSKLRQRVLVGLMTRIQPHLILKNLQHCH